METIAGKKGRYKNSSWVIQNRHFRLDLLPVS